MCKYNLCILINDATKYKQNLVQFERVSDLKCVRACAYICVVCMHMCCGGCVCVCDARFGNLGYNSGGAQCWIFISRSLILPCNT